MIYAALAEAVAAAYCATLAFLFGRRWLVSYERAKEAALIRTTEVAAQMRMELDALRESYGDSQSATNLKVRELGDKHESLTNFVTAFDEEHRRRLDALEQAPSSEPFDLTKYNKAVENLARQLHELSKVSATQEQLKGVEDRFNATLTGAVAKGARIRA